jgi:hypothetical protein
MGRPREELPPRRRDRNREPPQPPTTLGNLAKSTPWMWVSCGNSDCHRSVPLSLTPYVIRVGPDITFEEFKRRLTCTRCGHRGAILTQRSWKGSVIEWSPWPVDHYECGPDGFVNRRLKPER